VRADVHWSVFFQIFPHIFIERAIHYFLHSTTHNYVQKDYATLGDTGSLLKAGDLSRINYEKLMPNSTPYAAVSCCPRGEKNLAIRK